MKFYDVEQNSDDWFNLRVGKITSSKMATVMANSGKAFGEPAKKYAQEIALERVLGKRNETDSFQTPAMERGHELEPVARQLYEAEKIVDVKNGGFFENENLGDSPDGIVKDGAIEIKSVGANAHRNVIKKGGYDTKYKWQIHFHIWLTESKFCDFISFCPEFPVEKQLYIFRVERDENIITQMKIRIAQFEELVQKNLSFLK